MTPSRPPRILRRLVRASLPFEDREAVSGELDLLFAARVERTGGVSARLWYVRQAIDFLVRLAWVRWREATGRGEDYATDLRYAVRSIRRRPSFAVAAMLTLGAGSGVLATVYTAAEWLWLRRVPGIQAPDDLAVMRLGSREGPPFVSWRISHPDLVTLRERLPVAARLAGFTALEADLQPAAGAATRAVVEVVTANYFGVLGHQLLAGSGFSSTDDTVAPGSREVIISARLARTTHSREADALQSAITINGKAYRVVAVAGAGFRGAELPGRADAWVLLPSLVDLEPDTPAGAAGSRHVAVWRRMILRPNDAVQTAEIEAAANAVMQAVQREFRQHSYGVSHYTFRVEPGAGLDPSVRSTATRTLAMLSVAAGLLLMLAAANLGNLGLVESTRRANDRAIAAALGVSWARAFRAATIEIVLIGCGAVGLALIVASLLNAWFQEAQLDERGGALLGMTITGGVVLATTAAVMAAALVALLPPLVGGRPLLTSVARGHAGGGMRGYRVRVGLAAIQVAISLALVATTGLLLRSVDQLRRIDLGFAPDALITFTLDPEPHGYDAGSVDTLARELESGMTSAGTLAGFVSPVPMRSSYLTAALFKPSDPEGRPLVGAGYYVTAGFLPALGVRTLAGPPWDARSGSVVLTEKALTQLLPGVTPANAIGQILQTRRNGTAPVVVAAVIGDVNLSSLTREAPPTYFRPLTDRPFAMPISGVARPVQGAGPLEETIRTVLRSRAPSLTMFDVRTARAAVDLQFAQLGTMTRAASALGLIGIVLASAGLYGVLTNLVSARRREIAIRSAVGAVPSRLRLLVVRTAAAPLAAGLVAGGVLTSWAAPSIASQLFGVSVGDALTHATATLLVVVSAAAATLGPALQAGRVNPASVLRRE